MAITPSDFSKIWASNADTPEYTFTEADYLKGWDFVGNLPPTRAQWNAMQKSTDEKMKYVFDNFGAPLTASTVADMTMQNRVYVYTGSETGYTAGHWYYWNGSAWADGGVYNSNTVQVDPTLTISGAAADAKVVGNELIPTKYVLLQESDLQQGYWDDGAIIKAATSRLCNKMLIPVTPGDKITYTTSASLEFYVIIFDGDGHAVETTSYMTSTTATTYTVQKFGQMGIVFRGVGFSYITPARYTSSGAVFELYATISRNLQNVINKMPQLVDMGQLVTIEDGLFEIGSIYNGNNIASTNRIRTISGFWLPVGTVIKSYNYDIAVIEYNANGQYVDSQGFLHGTITTTQPYIRLLIAKPGNADISSAEISALVSDVKIFTDLFTLSANVHELSLGSDDFENLAPAYWKTYMQTHLPNIVSQVRESAMTGDSFVFFTDYHIEYNSGNSHLLMKKILDNSPIHKVVFGGDAFNGSETKDDTFNKLQLFADRFRDLPVYGIRGNHEYNLNDGGSESVKLTDNEIYNYIIAPCDDKITSPGKMYYYVDYQPRKIRYIFLDGRNIVGYDDYPIDDTQMTWLTSVLSELTADWSVVIFVHNFMERSGDTWYVSSNGEKIETAITNSNTPATICAIISGHHHQDYSMMKNGIAYIVTTCDQTPRSDPNRTAGTTSELAFDVFTIDTDAKTIKAYRVGYGDNRSWTYGQ